MRDVAASIRLADLGDVRTGAELAEARDDRSIGRVLPVRADVAPILPLGGLGRGSTVAVRGSAALAMALLAEATATGYWAAVVGMPGWGLLAAAELGVAMERLAVVPDPGGQLAGVVAALVDGIDLIVVGRPEVLDVSRVRRVTARARQRGTVLLPLGAWPRADVDLRCLGGRWHGLGAGHGCLSRRDMLVGVRGRGVALRSRQIRMVLPAMDPIAAPVSWIPNSWGRAG